MEGDVGERRGGGAMSRRTAVVSIDVTNGDKLVAMAQGTVLIPEKSA